MVWCDLVQYDMVWYGNGMVGCGLHGQAQIELQICSEWYGMMSFVKDKKTVVAPIYLAAVTSEHSPHIGLDTVI